MKTRILLLLFVSVAMACNSDFRDELDKTNKVLVLKVDYTTNQFEGGKELKFAKNTESFSISAEYVPPGDFGSVKMIYSELQEQLFFGEIIWMGTGRIMYPEWTDKSLFERVTTTDVVNPSGFEKISNKFDGNIQDYSKPWISVQQLVKVREYIKSNPNQTVKIYLYTPTVGAVDPTKAKWILFLKN